MRSAYCERSERDVAISELAFYAQDDDGNVWYMGQYFEEYEDGELVDAPTWIAGLAGLMCAVAAGAAADRLAASRVPDFPFKPDTFFDFSPSLLAVVLVLAVIACVVGALPPAFRAASGDPSEALAGR